MTLTPLFPGIPGATELIIVFVLIYIPILFLIGRWVYRDAKARNSNWAWQWAIGIVVLFLAGLIPGLLGIIIYLLVRGDTVRGTPR